MKVKVKGVALTPYHGPSRLAVVTACASNHFLRVYVHARVFARQFGTSKADVRATRKERIAKGVKTECSAHRNRTPLSSSMKHERA